MIEIGIISEVKDKKVRVAIGDMTTDFLGVIQLANSFAIHWKPLRVGEQCIVLPVRGDLNSGVVLRGLAYSSFDFPHTKEDEEFMIFEDGTNISYNTSTSTLNVKGVKFLNIEGFTKVKFSGNSIEHDGIDISKEHNHPQNTGDHFGGGIDTKPPNKA